MFRLAAPILPVRDVEAALASYARMGFEVRRYGPAPYGFASRDTVELHLGQVRDSDRSKGAAYVFVDDSNAVAAEWRAAGAEVHGPQDTEWGQHEGALVDPDGNVIRFGSPMSAAQDATGRADR
jgi:catechol 2,3-dioxygenase-like lactoylglutathione lyase family enzyme